MKPTQQFLHSHLAHFIAFGGGVGLASKAPGTWGTLVALPIHWMIQWLGFSGLPWITAAFLFALGIWAADKTGKSLGIADHGGIVIDEIAAFYLVLIVSPTGWGWVLLAFGLFRLFDIWKPWPISHFDRTLKGGFGVMFDDLLAAIFSIAVIWLCANIGAGFGRG